jgi:hypothetical protein
MIVQLRVYHKYGETLPYRDMIPLSVSVGLPTSQLSSRESALQCHDSGYHAQPSRVSPTVLQQISPPVQRVAVHGGRSFSPRARKHATRRR